MAEPTRTLRTTLSKIQGLGAAHAGTEHFWRQRLTAIANLILIIAFVGILLAAGGRDYATAVAIVSHPAASIVLLLLVISVAIHMRIGMTVVIEDYVHDKGMKLAAVILNTFFAAAVAAAALFAILKLGLGRVV
ncbi:succinate dehydrogenase, hydrophobic membrane anchor protein [Chelatococcus reniformis]|uniref:Succinate dehydrogenase hydrophobic membrane anchor subunit n=1 Tax=Chelatococcus reniformis TaxID=1494448 RepID=A0A916X7G7_9HYPH|nr:succinate dehydrogenase, hydrophobic membrane anchor protein [Chelatococcus reniformis]GGC51287.1 succinate dehydrogenase, hydrophobic membrane anchor protein [Chelatococcus reniformis]